MNGLGIFASGGWMSRVPRKPTGTNGAPVRSARRAGPVWPLCSTPSRDRVPSGKMPNSSPRSSTRAAAFSARSPALPPDRSIGIMPSAGKMNFVFQLSMYSALPTNVMRRGSVSGRNIESMNDVWFGHRIAGPSAGTLSSPSTCTFHAEPEHRREHRLRDVEELADLHFLTIFCGGCARTPSTGGSLAVARRT